MSKKTKKANNQNIDSEIKPLGLNPYLVTSQAKYYLGLFSRALAIALCVFSMLYFILDTIDILQYTSNLSLLIVSLIFTLPIVFSLQNKWAAWTSAVLAVVVICLQIQSFDFMRIVLVGTNLLDFTFDRLADMGFTYFINLSTGFEYIVDARTTVMYIVLALGLLISVLYSLSFGKKTNLYAPVIFNIIIVAPSFVCNILNTNWGTAFLAISYCVMAMLFVTDKLFCDMSNPKRYDTETVLNPAFVIGVDEPEFVDKKEKKKQAKIKKKQKYVALDDELDDLIGAPAAKKKGKLSKAEKEALRIEKRTKHLKKYAKSALAGFSALAIFVVGYLSILFPALLVEKNFKKISLIDGTMNDIREYVTALLLGDDLTLDLKSYENYLKNFEPHSTALTPKEYLEERRFHVEVQRMMPVYLRGWIANEFRGGSWYLNTEIQSFEEYRKSFGVRNDVHEYLLDLFYKHMNPNAETSVENYLTQYTTQIKFGYVAMQVNINRTFGGTTSLYVPTFIQSKYGLRSYRSVHENPDMTYSNFFDGIYTSRDSKRGAKYAFVANVPSMRDENYSTNISELIAEFNLQVDYLKYEMTLKGHQVPAVLYTCQSEGENYGKPVQCSATNGITPLGYSFEVTMPVIGQKVIKVFGPYGEYIYTYDMSTGNLISTSIANPKINPETGAQYLYVPPTLELAVRYHHIYTEDEQKEVKNLINQLERYTEYVYNSYTQRSGSEIITEFAENFINDINLAADKDISFSSQKYLDRHNLILAIVEYLRQNYTYTLTPSSMGSGELTGVENFLTEVKEGYCVQFASTLALTLREFGIPTRSVEGYVASDFIKNPYYGSNIDLETESIDTPLKYYTDVLDSDEHAWVEVWFDGIGWVQYEATPTMLSSYYPGMNVDDPDDPYNPPETETEISEETTQPDDTETSELLPEESTASASETTTGATSETTTPPIQIITRNFAKIFVMILPFAAIALLIYLEIRRIKMGDRKRTKLIADAKAATDDVNIKSLSEILSDKIFELLAILGMSPYENELPDEYKLRTARELIRIHELMKPKVESVEDYDASDDEIENSDDVEMAENIISDEEIMLADEYSLASHAVESLEAEEFGHGMNKAELTFAADFYNELLHIKRKKAGFWKTLIYRYVLNKI